MLYLLINLKLNKVLQNIDSLMGIINVYEAVFISLDQY
jgi:hypothetical protein